MRRLIIAILLIPLVLAQIDQETLDRQGDICGNGVREGYELCDDPKGREHGICPAAGKILKIAMVCNPQTCGCIPYKNKDCSNAILEGSEFCEDGTVDHCEELGTVLGKPLECNPSSCQCRAKAGTEFSHLLEEKPETTNTSKEDTIILEKPQAECGNRILEAGESCDPPGRICTYEEKGVPLQGICTDECSCGPLPSEDKKEQPTPTIETPPAETTTPSTSENSNKLWRMIIGIIILIVAGILVYLFVKHKHKKSNPLDEMEKVEDDEQQ